MASLKPKRLMKWSRKPRLTPLEHLVGPGVDSPDALRNLSDHDLYRYVGGWREGTAQHIAGMAEVRWRENKSARWAIYIASASLVVSVIALLKV